jgi:hypothetical protein
MTTSDAKENQEGGTRAGGDVESKGASQAPGGTGAGGTRAGGDVESKGASQAPEDESASQEV